MLYYLEATRSFASKFSHSVLPCIIVLIFGPFIAFAGAAWCDRPTVQMLSPAIPCHYHDTDIKMRDMLARHLGAFRSAVHSLNSYYRDYEHNPPTRNPCHPYPTSFATQDGLVKQFEYLEVMTGRNLFFGNMKDGNQAPICVKFVTRYGEQAHRFLAERNLAPKLHAVKRLPGGQYLVVMDDISNDYVSLFNFIRANPNILSEHNQATRNSLSEKIRECLTELHQAGFVHGDVRNSNIMVKVVGDDDLSFSFSLVDYDSSGEIRKVRYPLDLNTRSVKRPDGAVGGGIIELDHDIEMVEYIWNDQ